MKSTLIFACAMALLCSALAAASEPELSADEWLNRNRYLGDGCPQTDIGTITKVDVLTSKKILSLTKGQMKVPPSKLFPVMHYKLGKLQGFAIPNLNVALNVTGAKLITKMAGNPICHIDSGD